jgi:hypothetical protein
MRIDEYKEWALEREDEKTVDEFIHFCQEVEKYHEVDLDEEWAKDQGSEICLTLYYDQNLKKLHNPIKCKVPIPYAVNQRAYVARIRHSVKSYFTYLRYLDWRAQKEAEAAARAEARAKAEEERQARLAAIADDDVEKLEAMEESDEVVDEALPVAEKPEGIE